MLFQSKSLEANVTITIIIPGNRPANLRADTQHDIHLGQLSKLEDGNQVFQIFLSDHRLQSKGLDSLHLDKFHCQKCFSVKIELMLRNKG